MIAIGIGANSRATSDDVVAAIMSASCETNGADIVATLQNAAFANLVEEAACRHAFVYKAYSTEVMRERNDDCLTCSLRTLELFGVSSVAECAALAGAGPASRLVIARRIIGNVTVAAAKSADSKVTTP